jgi:hypothetical protein
MSVEFDEPKDNIQGRSNSEMTEFLIDKGITKTENQAFVILLAISIVFLVSSYFIFFGFGDEIPQLTEEEKKAILEAEGIYE